MNCENILRQTLHWTVEVLYWAVGKDCCGRRLAAFISEALSLPKHSSAWTFIGFCA